MKADAVSHLSLQGGPDHLQRYRLPLRNHGTPANPRHSGALVQTRGIDAALGTLTAIPDQQALAHVGPLGADLPQKRRRSRDECARLVPEN